MYKSAVGAGKVIGSKQEKKCSNQTRFNMLDAENVRVDLSVISACEFVFDWP